MIRVRLKSWRGVARKTSARCWPAFTWALGKALAYLLVLEIGGIPLVRMSKVGFAKRTKPRRSFLLSHEEQLTEARKATRWARAAFWVVLVSALGAIAFGIFDHLPKLL